MKNICVFCGSALGNQQAYQQAATILGKALVNNNINLVYGGANIGLMRVIADEVLKGKKKVTGIMPQFLGNKEILHHAIDEMIIVDTMAERKQLLIEKSCGFIALPGGFGTLDEIAEVLTWYQLDLTNKPLAILNINGYYDHLEAQLKTMATNGFIRNEHHTNILFSTNPEEVVLDLLSFKKTPVDSKWVDELKKPFENR